MGQRGSNTQTHLVAIVSAILASSFLYWLSLEFHAAGVLGALQRWFAFLYLVPYLSGAVLGGDVHNPNSVVFFATLAIELYVVILAAMLVVRKVRGTGP
jgi:hypothetical protein